MFNYKLLKDLDENERNYLKIKFSSALIDSFHYSDNSRLYNQQYSQGWEDCSFAIIRDEKIILFAFATIMDGEVSYYGEPLRFVSAYDRGEDLRGAYDALFVEIKKQIKASQISLINAFHNDIFHSKYLSKTSKISVATSGYIDLTLPGDLLWKGVRKSFRSLLNWGRKELETETIIGKSASKSRFAEFKQFHREVSGRQTRSDDTWSTQFDMILNKEAFLTLCYYKNKLISGNLILLGLKSAYYGVAVNDRSLFEDKVSVGHWGLYSSVLYAKGLGIDKFVLGSVDTESLDEKLNNIAHFKRGFSSNIECELYYQYNF